MPTARALVSDLEIICENAKLSKDFPLTKRYLLALIARKRAKQIEQDYSRNGGIIEPTWIQSMGVMKATSVSSHDDPDVPPTCLQIARINIPSVIGLDTKEDRGVHRVVLPGNAKEYYPIPLSLFFSYDKSVEQFSNPLRYRIGNKLYCHPFNQEFLIYLILNEPMEGIVIDTTNKISGELIYADDYAPAQQYTVIEGGVNHEGINYIEGQNFVATSAYFTGNGKVKLTTQKRLMSLDDEYPISNDMANTVIMRILTEDFRLSTKQISDIANDANNQLNVVTANHVQD